MDLRTAWARVGRGRAREANCRDGQAAATTEAGAWLADVVPVRASTSADARFIDAVGKKAHAAGLRMEASGTITLKRWRFHTSTLLKARRRGCHFRPGRACATALPR